MNVLIEAWTGAARLSDSDGSKASPPAYPMEDTCRSSFRVIDSLLLKKKSLGVDFFFGRSLVTLMDDRISSCLAVGMIIQKDTFRFKSCSFISLSLNIVLCSTCSNLFQSSASIT
ncbi:hypothetical protein H4Q26_013056 [Puccinia striiformis f. sp. tritici PST-130]|nr:hypothetical protein H4Q26_013056 [Puccinia striiformis f. sp. tritici PST-130]